MGDVVRVYGGQVDPLERGTPKRVGHMVENIGEHIASSKKRASWKFTLGESDKVHELVLMHSVMSTKKVVEYDGREYYHNSTITPGDWTLVLMLEGLNVALEVRINEYETPDIPKYDLLIDRAPYRKMDVYRRNVKKGGAYQPSTHGHIQQGFHQSHWGPGGVTNEPCAPVAPVTSTVVRDTSKRVINREVAKDREINLIDTSVPEVTVPVQSLVFDPLATGPKVQQQPNSPVNLNTIFANGSQQPQQNIRAPSTKNFDPFANLQSSNPGNAPNFYGGPPPQVNNGYGFIQAPPPPQQQYHQGNGFSQSQYITPPTPNPMYPPPYNPQPNLNISNMMNPMQVHHGVLPKQQANQDININAFAGMR